MSYKKITDYSKYFGTAKKVLSKKQKSTDYRGLNTKHNYSSFWMDDAWDSAAKFGGLGARASDSTDMVKLVKLSNYRRAVTNFVKIVTKQDIPVLWHGATSYTDGKTITLSTDIKDSNFDVTVGLALHEASHIALTDFDILRKISNHEYQPLSDLYRKYPAIGSTTILYTFKDLLNWVEDRRIDQYIFSTSPGYKAYYHKLYDAYWNSKDVLKALMSSSFSDQSNVDHYMLHIVNMMSAAFNKKALPGLSDIVDLVDLQNISRLKTTEDAAAIAIGITDIIFAQISEDKQKPQAKIDTTKSSSDTSGSKTQSVGDSEEDLEDDSQSPTDTPSNDSGKGGMEKKELDEESDKDSSDDTSGGSRSEETQSEETQSEDNSSEGTQSEDNSSEDGESKEGGSEEESLPELSASEKLQAQKALEAQRKFLRGEMGKKSTTKKLQRQLDQVANQSIELQTVGGDAGTWTTLVIDYSNTNTIAEARRMTQEIHSLRDKLSNTPHNVESIDSITSMKNSIEQLKEDLKLVGLLEDFSPESKSQYESNIKQGLDMGGLLGKRLQLHSESRERIDTRLRSGKIDPRRLAHAGYGIEGIFRQINIDSYKKVCLHISLDGSGSMSGSKWGSCVSMTMAIAKAITYAQNIRLQVSIRATSNDQSPVIYTVYDSQKNKLSHLESVFASYRPCSSTPEGLCFEAMIKKNLLVPTSSEVDSYFLNISDGEPGMGGSRGKDYMGERAVMHTKSQVDILRNTLNMKVVSFFLADSWGGTPQERYQNLIQNFEGRNAGKMFRTMYGKDASVVDPTSAMHIAKELNKKFLTK